MEAFRDIVPNVEVHAERDVALRRDVRPPDNGEAGNGPESDVPIHSRWANASHSSRVALDF